MNLHSRHFSAGAPPYYPTATMRTRRARHGCATLPIFVLQHCCLTLGAITQTQLCVPSLYGHGSMMFRLTGEWHVLQADGAPVIGLVDHLEEVGLIETPWVICEQSCQHQWGGWTCKAAPLARMGPMRGHCRPPGHPCRPYPARGCASWPQVLYIENTPHARGDRRTQAVGVIVERRRG
jgi:hypothetical protein